MSYLSGKLNSGSGKFAGLVHSSFENVVSYNSLFASINGVAAVYNIVAGDVEETIDEEPQIVTYNYTNFSNNNLVVSNGANGKIVVSANPEENLIEVFYRRVYSLKIEKEVRKFNEDTPLDHSPLSRTNRPGNLIKPYSGR